MMRTLRFWSLGVALALAGGAPSVARAEPPAAGARAPAPRTQVAVQVVHATHSGRVDPALKPLEAQLRFTKYTGFEQISTANAQLVVGADASFAVEGARRLRVELIDRTPQMAKVRVRLTENGANLLDTTVSIPRDRTFIIGGPKYAGGVLILPVTVSY
jgi:hypothetical protein